MEPSEISCYPSHHPLKKIWCFRHYKHNHPAIDWATPMTSWKPPALEALTLVAGLVAIFGFVPCEWGISSSQLTICFSERLKAPTRTEYLGIE